MSDNLRGSPRRAEDREMNERMARIEQCVGDLRHHLIGNGQPGALSKINARIDATETRIDELIGWRRWVHGIALALGAMGGAVAWAWEHLWRTGAKG